MPITVFVYVLVLTESCGLSEKKLMPFQIVHDVFQSKFY